MRSEMKKSKDGIKKEDNKQFIRILGIVVMVIGLGTSLFLSAFEKYNDRVLYAERLNQMQEVTQQLFTGLEDVIETQWKTAQTQCNYIESVHPETIDDLTALLKQQISVNQMDEQKNQILAVDSNGRYYTQDGSMGRMAGEDYLIQKPDRISYVNNTVTGNETRMIFLQMLIDPVYVQVGEKKYS